MRIYLQSVDLDIWLYVEGGVINDKFDRQSREEITRGSCKVDFEKVIYCDIAKEIWDKLQSIYDLDM